MVTEAREDEVVREEVGFREESGRQTLGHTNFKEQGEEDHHQRRLR